MAWTEERVEMLKKLWAQGLSASQIAKELGGVTRNAVIGKVHRLGLSGRATPSSPPQRVSAVSARPRPALRPRRSIDISAPKHVPARLKVAAEAMNAVPQATGDFARVLNLTDHICRWPIGDPSEPGFQFCGKKSKSGSPYCEAHCEMAYQPTRRKRKKSSNIDAALDAIAASRRASW